MFTNLNTLHYVVHMCCFSKKKPVHKHHMLQTTGYCWCDLEARSEFDYVSAIRQNTCILTCAKHVLLVCYMCDENECE